MFKVTYSCRSVLKANSRLLLFIILKFSESARTQDVIEFSVTHRFSTGTYVMSLSVPTAKKAFYLEHLK